MATDFHLRARRILDQVARLAPEVREKALRRACGADPQLLHEVLSLLPHFVELADYEPERPGGEGWGLPDTSSFHEARVEADKAEAVDTEPQPMFNIDQYTTIQIVGRGGMGVVYRAVHMTQRRTVAIKLLRSRLDSARDLKRFTFEAEILRQLKHPAIARFSYSGITRVPAGGGGPSPAPERPYFVMEYVAGDPLTGFALLRQLNVRQRLLLLVRICEAVEYAHARGVVHCDLKPDNILVLRNGQPKILDFGVARLDAAYGGADFGGMAATLPYASPEQLSGRVEDLTPASDVYTLGLITHELLAGALPKHDADRVLLDLKKVRIDDDLPEQHPRNVQFRRALEALLARTLRQTAEVQFKHAGELRTELVRLLSKFPARSPWLVLATRLWRRVAGWTPRDAKTDRKP